MRVAWVPKFAYPVGMLLDRISPHFLLLDHLFSLLLVESFFHVPRKNQPLVKFLISHLREQCVFSLSGPRPPPKAPPASYQVSLSLNLESSVSFLCLSPPKLHSVSHLREPCLCSLSGPLKSSTTTTKVSVLSLSRHPWDHHHC